MNIYGEGWAANGWSITGATSMNLKNDDMSNSDKDKEKDAVASAVDAIVMCSTEIRIKELEEIADSDCMCSRHVFCDACDASRGLNEIKQEIRKLHGRLCT